MHACCAVSEVKRKVTRRNAERAVMGRSVYRQRESTVWAKRTLRRCDEVELQDCRHGIVRGNRSANLWAKNFLGWPGKPA